MRTVVADKKFLPGFRCIVDDGDCDSSGVVITDEERARTARYMQDHGIPRLVPDGGCIFAPRPVHELREVLVRLSAQHSERLRQMAAEGRLVVG